MSSAAVIPGFYGFDATTHANNIKNQTIPFAPSNIPNTRLLSGERRAVGAPLDMDTSMRRHTTGGPVQLSRSMSLQITSNCVVLPQEGGDLVFRNSSKENRPRDRAFSESDRSQKPQNSDRYKTELCRPFEESGSCKYGDKCQFAHGMQELRNLVRHPKYKTELCRTFHTVGICPYGPRCHFIHNPDEIGQLIKPSRDYRERTIGKPKLMHFPSAPLGSTGDLTPPTSLCDSPMSPLDLSSEYLLEALKEQARKLIGGEQSDFVVFSPSILPTIPSPSASEPASPFLSCDQGSTYSSYDQMQLRDNVFFPSEDSHSKLSSPFGYRPPSPPDSDPESYCESPSSPIPPVFSPTPTYAAQSQTRRIPRLPIFRGISMEESLLR